VRGRWFIFEAPEKTLDLGLDLPDIRFFPCFSRLLLGAMDIDTFVLPGISRGNQKYCPTRAL